MYREADGKSPTKLISRIQLSALIKKKKNLTLNTFPVNMHYNKKQLRL